MKSILGLDNGTRLVLEILSDVSSNSTVTFINVFAGTQAQKNKIAFYYQFKLHLGTIHHHLFSLPFTATDKRIRIVLYGNSNNFRAYKLKRCKKERKRERKPIREFPNY